MYYKRNVEMLQRRSNSEVVRLRLPADLRSAVFAIATRDFTSASAIIRQAVADRVRRDGVEIIAADERQKA